jgi:hypothetical protein
MALDHNQFEIEREIYRTQWENIQRNWDQTFSAVQYLSTLIILAIFPLKFLRIESGGKVILGVDPAVQTLLKAFVLAIIFLLGLVTLLNQYNHYARSKEARKVVVAIEKRWGLYDNKEVFIFQDRGTKYSYNKFAGGEKRITHAKIIFAYIILITFTALAFVWFA